MSNLQAANPFDPNDNSVWNGNNMILSDPAMRKKAGVVVLDSNVSDLYTQGGGGAVGAPFWIKNYGGPNAVTYEQAGGGFPQHYYNNNKKW